MYERIILQSITDGANSLPSVVCINNFSYYDAVTNFTTHDNTYNEKLFNGQLGNNTNDFSIEFYFPQNITDTSSEAYQNYKYMRNSNRNKTYKLYSDMTNVSILKTRLSKEYLTQNFKIIEIPDYSSQAATYFHYDFIPKVFTATYKIPNFYCFVLKSYTMKKAWILISNNFDDDITKVIIDFNYKKLNDESINNLKYNYLDNTYNMAEIYNTMNYSSPYFDRATIDKNFDGKAIVLESQSNYFKNQIKNNYNKPLSNKNSYKYTTQFIHTHNAEPDSFEFNIKYTDDFSIISSKYVNSNSYEVYKIQLVSGKYIAKRYLIPQSSVMQLDESDDTGIHYEVFAMNPMQAHYIFKCKSNTKNTDIKLDNIKYNMQEQHIYLYNSNFTNFDELSIDGNRYVEVYIPLIKVYGSTGLFDKLSGKVIFESDSDIIFSNSYKTDSDPTFYNETLLDDQTITPIYNKDKYVNSILQEGNVRIIDRVEDPVSLYDFEFNTNEKIINNPNIDIVAKDSNINNTISTDDFRSSLSTTEYFETKQRAYKNLCNNLYKLIPDTSKSELAQYINGSKISLKDCLFVYIKKTDDNVEPLHIQYSFDGINYETDEYIYSFNDNDEFIITSSSDSCFKILDENCQYCKVY